MSEHRPYKIILREELRNCWDMIREQRRPEPPFDMDMDMDRIPFPTRPDTIGGRSDDTGGRGKPPRFGVRIRKENGFLINDQTGERKPELGIVLDPPAWLLAWFESQNIPWPRAGHYLRRVDTPGGPTLWQMYDEQGVVVAQYLIFNNQVYPIPGDWEYTGTDNTGMPIFDVVNADPPFETPLDGSYREFEVGAFPGVPWAVRRFSDGRWRADHNSDGNWNDPAWNDPNGTQINPDIPEGFPNGTQDQNQTWFDGLSGGEQFVLIMLGSATILALGGLLGAWLVGNGHLGGDNSAPPVIPDGGGNPGDGDGGDGGEGEPPGI